MSQILDSFQDDPVKLALLNMLGSRAPTMPIEAEEWDYVPKTARPMKARRKALQVFRKLRHVTEDDIEDFRKNAQHTTTRCVDPYRHVIKREWVAFYIGTNPTINGYIAPKIFSQLVLLSSYYLPRFPLTIKANTSNRYLLMEVQEPQIFPAAILVADWILSNQEWAIPVASQRYQKSSIDGGLYLRGAHPKQQTKEG